MKPCCKATWKKGFLVLLIIALIAGLYFYVHAAIEMGRRRHRIGQLWSLIRFYYCPAHEDKFPSGLEELRHMPEYVPYFDRTLHEVELVAPGVDVNSSPGIIVLREKQPDKWGRRWVHLLDGSAELQSNGAVIRPGFYLEW